MTLSASAPSAPALPPPLPAAILGTGSALPKRRIRTGTLILEAMPDRDPELMEEGLGITWRHWVDRSTPDPVATLAAEALEQALDAAGLAAGDLKRIILATSTSGDRLIPATANAIAARLGLSDHAGCLDINNACVGYLTALDTAARLVATGVGPVGVVASEVFSKHISPASPRSYVVMGDAAGAAIVGSPSDAATDRGAGVLASAFGNDGSRMHMATLNQSALTGAEEHLEFGAGGRDIGAEALRAALRSTEAVLTITGRTLAEDDVRWLLPHQPNGALLDRFLTTLQVPEHRTARVVHDIGSVGAASVAVAMDRLFRHPTHPPEAGDALLLSAVGGGTAWGGLLLQT